MQEINSEFDLTSMLSIHLELHLNAFYIDDHHRSPSATDISSINRAGDRCIPQWLHRMGGLPIRRDAGQVGGSYRGRLHDIKDILLQKKTSWGCMVFY